MNAPRNQAIATLFCAIVAKRKGHQNLWRFLHLLPLSPQMKTMALRSCPAGPGR